MRDKHNNNNYKKNNRNNNAAIDLSGFVDSIFILSFLVQMIVHPPTHTHTHRHTQEFKFTINTFTTFTYSYYFPILFLLLFSDTKKNTQKNPHIEKTKGTEWEWKCFDSIKLISQKCVLHFVLLNFTSIAFLLCIELNWRKNCKKN